ncbi:DNA polymerase III subunit chi [Pseudotabrizicola sp. L79]|uniref:DNA polymerase III subunit chi n=1 Tax=Pseudotabrizicola sp. L79 TaxID=3118402 RepID=UPI002F93A389
MGIVMFYHLTRSGSEQTLRLLLDRALGQGWRIMIRSGEAAQLNRLDERLWLHPEDGFVPHGIEGGPHDADQPVLLGQGPVRNGARGLMLLDGADTTLDEARDLERVWVIFDGADPDRLGAARALWKRVTDAGLAAQYWSEESGRWEKKAEKG